MKKKKAVIGAIVCLVLTLIVIPALNCSPCIAQTAQQQKKTRVIFAAGNITWRAYPISVAKTNLISKNSNLEIVLESKPGGKAIIESVARGDADISMAWSYPGLVEAYQGIGTFANLPWTPAKDLRLLIGGVTTYVQSYITSPARGIKTFQDLKGKVIPDCVDTRGGIQEASWAILRAYGLDLKKDVKIVVVDSTDTAWKEIIMGRIDAVHEGVTEKLLEKQEDVGRVITLSIDKDMFEKAKATEPEIFRGIMLLTVNPNDVPGVKMDKPVNALGFHKEMLINKKVSEDVAYTLVMTIMKHMGDISKISIYTKYLTKETALPSTDLVSHIPWHPGAIKAFKELGLWTPKHEEVQKALLK